MITTICLLKILEKSVASNLIVLGDFNNAAVDKVFESSF